MFAFLLGAAEMRLLQQGGGPVFLTWTWGHSSVRSSPCRYLPILYCRCALTFLNSGNTYFRQSFAIRVALETSQSYDLDCDTAPVLRSRSSLTCLVATNLQTTKSPRLLKAHHVPARRSLLFIYFFVIGCWPI